MRKKLTKGELNELIKRVELINEYKLIAQALDLQRIFWLNEKLKQLGFDINKQYEVSYKSGKIIEKDEPVGTEKKPQ